MKILNENFLKVESEFLSSKKEKPTEVYFRLATEDEIVLSLSTSAILFAVISIFGSNFCFWVSIIETIILAFVILYHNFG